MSEEQEKKPLNAASSAGSLDDLSRLLRDLDGHGYRAYKRTKGAWRGADFTLHVDHVQGDPFATPSKLRLHLPPPVHGIPRSAWSMRARRVGLCDFLLRTFKSACADLPRVGGSGKSGLVIVSVDSPIVLERGGR